MIYRAFKRNSIARAFREDKIPPPEAFLRERDSNGEFEEELSYYWQQDGAVDVCDSIGGPSQLREIFGLVHTDEDELPIIIEKLAGTDEAKETYLKLIKFRHEEGYPSHALMSAPHPEEENRMAKRFAIILSRASTKNVWVALSSSDGKRTSETCRKKKGIE